MTNIEFSNGFDTLLNSFNIDNSSNITLDEYEKSFYLTKAQEDIVRELYSGRNNTRESFENTEELKRSLDSLVNTITLTEKTTVDNSKKINKDSVFYTLPDNIENSIWFITYESVLLKDDNLCEKEKSVIVTPITQDDYDRINKNPFRQANSRRVLRLDAGNNIVELISKYNISSYLVRYLKKPTPIILIDLPDDLSINGVKDKTECNLNPMIHNRILERAVQLALQSKSINSR